MNKNNIIPVLPLRDVVVFPGMVVPLFVGREISINALEEVMRANKKILLVTQKNSNEDSPKYDDLYNIGTLSHVLQLLKLPDGTFKVLVEGQQRAKVIKYIENEKFFTANYNNLTRNL